MCDVLETSVPKYYGTGTPACRLLYNKSSYHRHVFKHRHIIFLCHILQMQEKKECNDVQHHVEMFTNGIGSQNWRRTRPYRPGN